MKNLLLLISVVIVFLSCNSVADKKSVWTDAYEAKLYSQIDNELKPRLPDDANRNELVAYIIKGLKVELPNGVESVSNDSLYRLSVKLGKEYAYANANKKDIGMVPIKRPWTITFEKDLRETMLSKRGGDIQLSESTCDCIIEKLKQIYPDSVVVPFPKQVISEISVECYKQTTK
jgi:hypothetical protein